MKLTQLTLKNFRNFSCYELQPKDQFNLIIADNGRGKTSILEAIYFLGLGRSFRNHPHQSVIQYQQTYCQVIGEFRTNEKNVITIGVEKHHDATKSQLKI